MNILDAFKAAKVAFGMTEPSVVTDTPVREQNVDATGNIKVHEQGVVDVNVVSGGAGRLIELGTVTLALGEVQWYPMVEVGDCVEISAMAKQTSGPPAEPGNYIAFRSGIESPDGVTGVGGVYVGSSRENIDGLLSDAGPIVGRHRYVQIPIYYGDGNPGTIDITAWIWCARQ